MKKLCFFMFLLITFTSKTLANANDLQFESDTLTADRVILLNLDNWKAKKIQVSIRNQDGNLVFQDKLVKVRTDAKRYVLNDLAAGSYQLEVKSRSKRYLKSFSVTYEKQQHSQVEVEVFNPVLQQIGENIDITTKIKEQWYQFYHNSHSQAL